ncbi:HAD family hydrolase [Peribacillus sp. NPDC097264]|uniref:HAD family hydrolase n=1 Tax=Peribacillus sp. NPDC097264 TaxID=3390616 RepID=UPI003CFDBAD3
MIGAVIFDMDDTLYSEYDFVKSGLKAVDHHLSFNNIKGFYEIAIVLFNKGIRNNLFNKTLEFLNVGYSELDIKNLVFVYRNHTPNISLSDETINIIKWLSSKYKMGLLTDGFLTTQEKKVKALELDKYFDVLIYSDQYGRKNWKPSNVPYLKVMEYFKLDGPHLLYVGDNASKDFISAKKLGWLTIQLQTEQGIYKNISVDSEYEAHYKITSISQLRELLCGKICSYTEVK